MKYKSRDANNNHTNKNISLTEHRARRLPRYCQHARGLEGEIPNADERLRRVKREAEEHPERHPNEKNVRASLRHGGATEENLAIIILCNNSITLVEYSVTKFVKCRNKINNDSPLHPAESPQRVEHKRRNRDVIEAKERDSDVLAHRLGHRHRVVTDLHNACNERKHGVRADREER